MKKNKSGTPRQQRPPAKSDNSLPSASHTSLTRTEAFTFSGPIPPPELLAKYEEIIPNGADRILKMAENQSLHRQHLEKWAVIGGTILSYFGVACALIIALFTIYSGSNLIYKGNVVSGSIFAGIGLLGLVSAFIYGTRSRREERLRRDQLNKELIYRK